MAIHESLQDGRDLLDEMFEQMYPNSDLKMIIPNRCTRSKCDAEESVLDNIIQSKIQNRALPLALRKRLLYEQARAS